MGYYKHVDVLYRGLRGKTKKEGGEALKELFLERKKTWRREPSVVRVEHPTRINRARQIGYKAKQGFVVARARVRRGRLHTPRPARGRRPKRMGVLKLTPSKSIQRVAEERANKKYPNMEVLGSYWILEDGRFKWYEVVLADPHHPQIKKDRDVSWVTKKQHRKRALRGLTPAGKKGRGLRNKGRGAEKVRPSLRAKGRKSK